MKEQYANQIIDFCNKYNCVTRISNENFKKALTNKDVASDGKGITKLLQVNGSYFTHEFIRKLPKELQELKTNKLHSWIYFILLYINRCPICNGIKKNLNNTTCSHGCANTYFRSGDNHPNYTGKGDRSHRAICFQYHGKYCIVCGESNIVEAHHLDENHSNNSPENLIPLCSTHHKYIHSKFRYLIEDKVLSYIKNRTLKGDIV